MIVLYFDYNPKINQYRMTEREQRDALAQRDIEVIEFDSKKHNLKGDLAREYMRNLTLLYPYVAKDISSLGTRGLLLHAGIGGQECAPRFLEEFSELRVAFVSPIKIWEVRGRLGVFRPSHHREIAEFFHGRLSEGRETY